MQCSQIHSSSMRPGRKWQNQIFPRMTRDFAFSYQKYAMFELFWLTSLSIPLSGTRKGLSPCPPLAPLFSSSVFFLHLMWKDKGILPPHPLFLILMSQEIIDFSGAFHFFWHFNVPVSLQFSQLNNHRKTFWRLEPRIFDSLLQISRVRMVTQLATKMVPQAVHPGFASPIPLDTFYWQFLLETR